MLLMRKFIFNLGLLCLVLAITGCSKKQNKITTRHLMSLDSLLDEHPQLVLDRLAETATKRQSRFNSAYSALLQTIAQDKTGFHFPSDSIIQNAVDVLSHYQKEYAELYARSLLYKGIVRYRMGVTDSTAYVPIKMAAHVLENAKLKNSKSALYCYYYLGTLFFENENSKQSIEYLKKSIQVAQQLGYRNDLFNSCRDLAWSYMQNNDWDNTKLCIDTLTRFQDLSATERLDINLIESSYYESVGKPEKALFINMQLLTDTLYLKGGELSEIYYKLSGNYRQLQFKTQSLLYAEKAVENINDTTKFYNYYYYQNISEIAASLKQWEKSLIALTKAYQLKSKLIESNLKASLLELEKKYDLNQIEIKARRYKTQIYLYIGIIVLLFLLICSGLILRRQFKIRKEAEVRFAKSEKQRIEIEYQKTILNKERLENELKQKNFLLPIYRQISERNEMVKKVLEELKMNPYLEKNELLLRKIESTHKDFIQFSKIDPTMFFSEKDFFEFTDLEYHSRLELLNSSDKIMLIFARFKLDNNQIAILLNTTEDSVRSRKSKLRKKLLDNNIVLKQIHL